MTRPCSPRRRLICFPACPGRGVAYLGRLAPQKDVGTLLEAFARLPAGAQLLVVGDGPDRPAMLQRRAQRFGSRVQFTGFVPHVQVPAVLRHVDMLVLPSRYEDLSSALIEAMAAGLPVVATRVGGTADLVHDGVNGLLVAPRDPAALAAAISRVLADPAAASWPRVGGRAAHRRRLRLARSCPQGARGLQARDRPPAMTAERQAPGSRARRMPRSQRPPPGPQPSRHRRGTAGDRPEPHAPAGPRYTGSMLLCLSRGSEDI